MKIHEFAKIFPDMNAEQFDDLKADIEKNGQINPIITFKGEVIDGKNRLKACKELNKEPYTEKYKGDPENLIPFVISQNLQRRHLDSSQRAAASLKCLDLLEAEAKKRQGQRNDLKPEEIPPIKGPSAEQAAKMFGTNKEYVKGAKKIKEKMPEKMKELESGKKSVPQLLKEVKEKEETEAAANRDDGQTRSAFWQLYTGKHSNRESACEVIAGDIDKFPEFSKNMEKDLASILKSYKTHKKDLPDILNKIQTNGNGQQPNHEPFNDTINKCNDVIAFLKKIILLYEAANENVQFYADNRDTLNKVFKKEAKEIVEGFKPAVWKIDYYDDKDKIKYTSNNLDTEDISVVKSAIKTRIPDDTCTKAVATVSQDIPYDFHSLHLPYVKIKEFKHKPVTVSPKKGEKYLKKPDSKSEPSKGEKAFLKTFGPTIQH